MPSTHTITVPEVAMVAMTRAALGIGVGLLLASWLSPEGRKAAGWSLVVFGGLVTIPLVMEVLGSSEPEKRGPPSPAPIRRRAAAG